MGRHHAQRLGTSDGEVHRDWQSLKSPKGAKGQKGRYLNRTTHVKPNCHAKYIPSQQIR